MKLKIVDVLIFAIGCIISYKAGIIKCTSDFSRTISRACDGDEECVKVLVESVKLGDKLEKKVDK